MQENDFRNWLSNKYNNKGTVNSRLKNCLRIEQFEGDLDMHFETDKCGTLLQRLTYTTDDEKHKRSPKHKISINGNIKNGTATLKQAINLYVEFKQSGIPAGTSRILAVVFNLWIRNPETGKTPYKIISSVSDKNGDCGLDLKIPGRFETLFAYQFDDYEKCEKAKQILHKLLAKYHENGEWFTMDDNQLALIKLSCEEVLGGTLIAKNS